MELWICPPSQVGKVSTRRFWLLPQSLLWESAFAPNRWVWLFYLHIKEVFLTKPFRDTPFSSLMPRVGLSDIPGEAMVKLYCPKCMDVYTPKSSRHHHTDGAYFGTGFPHMLFMVHPENRPKRPANQFVPRCVWLHYLLTNYHFKPILTFLFFLDLWHSNKLCVEFCFELFFSFQAVWFQNSPNGLSTPTPGCIKLQESS